MANPLPLICLTLASPLIAQPQGGVFASHSSLDSAVSGAGFGQSVALIEDLNLDGIRDVAIGAPYEAGTGVVHVQAGGGSIFTQTFPGTTSGGMFGWSVAGIGPSLGTGTVDLLIGAPGQDEAFVFDGDNPSTWFSVSGPTGSSFGWSVIALGDLTADNIEDFAVGAPLDSPNGLVEAGSVFVYSGADGSLLRSFHGSAAGDHFGFALTSLADNSAGTGGGPSGPPALLLAIGAPDTILGGHAVVYDAVTGALIFAADGSVNAIGSSFGYALAALSDSDGDGIEELAVGAPYFATGAFGFNVGKVEVFSPGAGTSLHALVGDENFNIFGRQICGADVDGDGIAELVVRSFKSSFAQIEIFSGLNGQLLFEIEGTPDIAGIGTSMAGGGDITNDGFPDIVLGAPLADTAAGINAGKALVYGIHTVLSIDQSAFDSVAGGFVTFQINFPATERFRGYMLLASGGTGPIKQDGVIVPLSNDHILRRMISNNPMFPGQQGTLNLHGDAQVVFYVPPNMLNVLIGTTLYFAAVSGDGNGARASSVAVPIDIVSGGGAG